MFLQVIDCHSHVKVDVTWMFPLSVQHVQPMLCVTDICRCVADCWPTGLCSWECIDVYLERLLDPRQCRGSGSFPPGDDLQEPRKHLGPSGQSAHVLFRGHGARHRLLVLDTTGLYAALGVRCALLCGSWAIRVENVPQMNRESVKLLKIAIFYRQVKVQAWISGFHVCFSSGHRPLHGGSSGPGPPELHARGTAAPGKAPAGHQHSSGPRAGLIDLDPLRELRWQVPSGRVFAKVC